MLVGWLKPLHHVAMPDAVPFSRLLKVPVFGGDRHPLGRLLDASAVLAGEAPALHQLVIGSPRSGSYLVPSSMVESWDAVGIQLAPEGDDVEAYRLEGHTGREGVTLGDEEVLLGRDILDSQVVDLSNRHLARVSEVLMTGPARERAVTAVDLGMGALLSRIGLGWLGSQMSPTIISWEDLHLASARGHSVQLAADSERLRRLDSVALADVIARLATTPAIDVLRAVGASRSIDALDASHDVHRRRLMRAMPTGEADRIVEDAPDELARSLEALRGARDTAGRRFLRTAGWRLHRPVSVQP